MPPAELACKELVELVTDYLDGTLSPVDRARFEEHLAACAPCRTYIEQMRQTIAVLGHLTEDSIPHETRDTLLQLFHDWKQN